MSRSLVAAVVAVVLGTAHAHAHADALDTLKSFTADAKTGRAAFTQTVTSPDGKKQRKSSGSFEFSRPNRFRFAYAKPYEQLIVGDGEKVWLFDTELNQVTVRPFSQALGATPAALLAGSAIERDFTLRALPDEGGLQWAEASPKLKDSGIQTLKIGFRAGGALAAIEILDGFGQRSRIDFSAVENNPALAADRFQFKPPAGADVLSQ
nr:outer membrane lipoprotein chaperone LolA [Rivibacter subsaxonicus]